MWYKVSLDRVVKNDMKSGFLRQKLENVARRSQVADKVLTSKGYNIILASWLRSKWK